MKKLMFPTSDEVNIALWGIQSRLDKTQSVYLLVTETTTNEPAYYVGAVLDIKGPLVGYWGASKLNPQDKKSIRVAIAKRLLDQAIKMHEIEINSNQGQP